MVKSGATTGLTAIVETDQDFNIWSPLAVIRSCDRFEPYYVLNFMRSKNFQEAVTLFWSFGTQQNIGMGVIENLEIAIPPIDEQREIAQFLTRETTKLDALITEQRTLIDLLKEKRQAVISHAVTKGLDPRVPMKDSGVEWLGEVPAHWDFFPIKRELQFLTSGSRGWADHYADEGPLFIRIGNLTRDDVGLDLSDIQRVQIPQGSEGERTRVQPGDVLFSITAYIGSVAVVPENLETAYVSQHVALARLNAGKLLPEWVAYFAKSLVGKIFLENQGYGGTKVQLSLDDVANLPVTVPPLDEQHRVVSCIREEAARLDALTAEAQTTIALLQERRSALISAAVTGKIDVRGRALTQEIPKAT